MTHSTYNVRADEVEFYPAMADITLAKGWEREPYTGRTLGDADQTITFIANANGIVLPTTRRPVFADPNLIAGYRADGYFVFGALTADQLAEGGVKTAPDILAYAAALTQMVRADEKTAKPFGLDAIVQKNGLPRLKQCKAA